MTNQRNARRQEYSPVLAENESKKIHTHTLTQCITMQYNTRRRQAVTTASAAAREVNSNVRCGAPVRRYGGVGVFSLNSPPLAMFARTRASSTINLCVFFYLSGAFVCMFGCTHVSHAVPLAHARTHTNTNTNTNTHTVRGKCPFGAVRL